MFAVRLEHVSKVYKIGRQRQFTQLFASWAGQLMGKSGGRPRHWALNDVSVEKDSREHMVNLIIEIDGRPLSRWGCDGLVCATPTGSKTTAAARRWNRPGKTGSAP